MLGKITPSHPFTLFLLIFKRGSNKPRVLMRARWRRGFSFALCFKESFLWLTKRAPSAPFKRLLWALFSTARVYKCVCNFCKLASAHHQRHNSLCGSFYAPNSPPLSVIFIIENGQRRVRRAIRRKIKFLSSLFACISDAVWLTLRGFNSLLFR
jgi:hypothetical protein